MNVQNLQLKNDHDQDLQIVDDETGEVTQLKPGFIKTVIVAQIPRLGVTVLGDGTVEITGYSFALVIDDSNKGSQLGDTDGGGP